MMYQFYIIMGDPARRSYRESRKPTDFCWSHSRSQLTTIVASGEKICYQGYLGQIIQYFDII